MKTEHLFSDKSIEMSPRIMASGFTGQQLMVTHLIFEEGAVGASHSHSHEQMTIILQGEVEFTLGEERQILRTGDVLNIPSHIVHGVVALTRTEMIDIFTPLRLDLVEKLKTP